jgi:hypothetical protein
MPTLTTPYHVGASIVVEHELNKFGSSANIAAQVAHPLEAARRGFGQHVGTT